MWLLKTHSTDSQWKKTVFIRNSHKDNNPGYFMIMKMIISLVILIRSNNLYNFQTATQRLMEMSSSTSWIFGCNIFDCLYSQDSSDCRCELYIIKTEVLIY